MNPTLTLVSRFLEQEFAQRGYSLMLSASDHDAAKERSALEVFRSRQVDGILIYPTNHDRLEHIRAVRQAGYPVLVLADIPFSGLDVVAINDRSGHRAVQPDRALSPHRHARCGAIARQYAHDGALRAASGGTSPKRSPYSGRAAPSTDGFRAIAEQCGFDERLAAPFATTDLLVSGRCGGAGARALVPGTRHRRPR